MNNLIKGEMLLGNKAALGSGPKEHAYAPTTGKKMEPAFASANQADIQTACALAEKAFDAYRNSSIEQRATFLETIAEEILALGDILVQRTVAESGLPQARIEGERGRTIGQLQLFANVVRSGTWLGARLDPALPDRTPMARPDLRLRHIPIGPVAIFGASNFPLAFSVAGGDTASALAAGCPVIVKAHPAHPGTSELVGKAIQTAANKCHMPDGVFSLIYGSNHDLGSSLVSNSAVKAVGFTGSRAGGLALMSIAANRSEPIPVFAEMSSINPVFLLPHALQENSKGLADDFVGSLTMGAGQFCTNPGLLIGIAGDQLSHFIECASSALASSAAQVMLSSDIHAAYGKGVDKLSAAEGVSALASGLSSAEPNCGQARLFTTSATQFLSYRELQDEVFGAAALIVECNSSNEIIEVAKQLDGQLTATMQLNDADAELAKQLMPILERKAGRILCNAYPTGVEVCHAMVHGGPFPATSNSQTTSVGSLAIQRFLRPVCYQDIPESLLPAELQEQNGLAIPRLYDGSYQS